MNLAYILCYREQAKAGQGDAHLFNQKQLRGTRYWFHEGTVLADRAASRPCLCSLYGPRRATAWHRPHRPKVSCGSSLRPSTRLARICSHPSGSRTMHAAIFVPSLAAAMANEKSRENIDTDPVTGDQDEDNITAPAVETVSQGSRETVVLATFRNFGQPRKTAFTLVRDGKSWRKRTWFAWPIDRHWAKRTFGQTAPCVDGRSTIWPEGQSDPRPDGRWAE